MIENSSDKILLVVPCFNCSAQIRRVLPQLFKTVDEAITEVIFIDNCSQDGTPENIESYLEQLQPKNWRLLRNAANLGLGGTFKRGLEYAVSKRYKWLVFFHGDDQARANDIKQILQVAKQNDSNAVLGSRFALGAHRQGYSTLRLFGNLLFNFLFSVFTGKLISDIGSGLNAYKVEALTACGADKCSNHIAFDAEILLKLLKIPGGVTFSPIEWHQKDQKSNANNMSVGFALLKILCQWRFSRGAL